jgi:hypothetical protein
MMSALPACIAHKVGVGRADGGEEPTTPGAVCDDKWCAAGVERMETTPVRFLLSPCLSAAAVIRPGWRMENSLFSLTPGLSLSDEGGACTGYSRCVGTSLTDDDDACCAKQGEIKLNGVRRDKERIS